MRAASNAIRILANTSSVIPRVLDELQTRAQTTDSAWVRTPQVSIQGTSIPGVDLFLGVPYADAEPFSPPKRYDFVSPNPQSHHLSFHTRTLLAKAYGPACPQMADAKRNGPFIFDLNAEEAKPAEIGKCLNLAIYRSNSSRVNQGRLPVLVWIHGGTYSAGSNGMKFNNPTDLVRRSNNFGGSIVVVPNYRLGIYGFASFDDRTYSNMAMDDVREALEWVQDNIAYFGGDPSNVTLAGFSAGGNMVSWQAILQAQRQQEDSKVRSLFHRIYMMSGLYSIEPLKSLAEARSDTKTIAKHTGLIDTDDPVKLRQHLIQMSTKEAMITFIRNNEKENMFRPVLDLEMIRYPGRDYLESGYWPKIRTVITTTAQDGSIFAKPAMDKVEVGSKAQAFIAEVAKSLKPEVFDRGRVFSKYKLGNGKISHRITEIITDVMFRCPALYMVQVLSRHGVDIWYGEHQITMAILDALAAKSHMQSFHSIDQLLLFGAMSLHIGSLHHIASVTMQERFISYMNGDKQSDGPVSWLKRLSPAFFTTAAETQANRCYYWIHEHKGESAEIDTQVGDYTPINLKAAKMALEDSGTKVDNPSKELQSLVMEDHEDLSEWRKTRLGITASPEEDRLLGEWLDPKPARHGSVKHL